MSTARPVEASKTFTPGRVDELRVAAINAAAVAGVAYYMTLHRYPADLPLETERFRYVLKLGLRHGAMLGELAHAAGISCEQASALVNGGAL